MPNAEKDTPRYAASQLGRVVEVRYNVGRAGGRAQHETIRGTVLPAHTPDHLAVSVGASVHTIHVSRVRAACVLPPGVTPLRSES